MRAAWLAVPALAAALLTGCGDDGGGAVGGDGSGARPTGADEIVVQVRTTGGLVPVETRLGELPEITIYGDGRIVAPGPTIEIYPPPALPNLQEGNLTEEQVDEVLATAEAAGLLADEPPNYGEPEITDLPTTSVKINAEGDERDVSAYALGSDDGLSDNERAAREDLREFIADLPVDAADERYEPEAVAVFVLPDDVTAVGEPPPSDAVEWPLGDLAGAGETTGDTNASCLVLIGRDATTVLDAAETTTTQTPWLSGGDEYTLVFRPLLPDESTCADLGARLSATAGGT